MRQIRINRMRSKISDCRLEYFSEYVTSVGIIMMSGESSFNGLTLPIGPSQKHVTFNEPEIAIYDQERF